ncbi:SURF1 family protein [Amylibacter sp. IMCC11727]|uniref:SURF1 family protein n=1 Tax=Amylibacter sp. IMCC11727 TaxID=3039851 RepID=UPI00244DAD3C|nr:SURF1 family protein [Amylibacter sp. IMCC11727]WGI23011.1 SURF1 family protein [Amylibacter sp. IMCC11727]
MTVRMILPLLFGVVGVAVLLWLGFWQLDRLAWKEERLAVIAAKIAATPEPLIDHFKSTAPKSETNYTRVKFEGVLTDKEAHVLTSVKYSGPGSQSGPGFRVLKEVVWNGKNFLLDLGFVPEAQKNDPRATGPVRVIGNILDPDDYDASFTPDPDLEANIWFARYLPQMAQELEVLPFMVVVEQAEVLKDDVWVPFDDVTPLPVSVNIPNDHREYAITWFSLAFVWFGMTCYLLWRIRQKTV